MLARPAAAPLCRGENAQQRPRHPASGTDGDRPEFVGRDAELNALHAAAGEAVEHSALRVALLAGDPGAGKTAPGPAAGIWAGRWRVAVGRCPEAAGAPPAWAWVETLRTLTADVDPGPLTPALAPLLDEKPDGAAKRTPPSAASCCSGRSPAT